MLRSQSVYELTGLKKADNSTSLKLTNNNRNRAVTVHLYFLNNKGQNYFDFLLVLECGESLTFDPFDLEIPGAGGYKTSNYLFGYGLPSGMADSFPAERFGSGRFVLSVVAVGAGADGDNEADILYPSEVPLELGACGVTTINQGGNPGLQVGNARPIVFDYLSGNHVHAGTQIDGTSFRADESLRKLSAFTRTLVAAPGRPGFMLAEPGNSDLLAFMAGQMRATAGTVTVPATAVFTWGLAPFTFLPGGR
jgi:hypothetical protein